MRTCTRMPEHMQSYVDTIRTPCEPDARGCVRAYVRVRVRVTQYAMLFINLRKGASTSLYTALISNCPRLQLPGKLMPRQLATWGQLATYAE
jgi:hypothetical protein